ncbi:MAG: hypothetical protein ACRDXX_19865, partial [Stackebrandtia sp.]
MSFLSSFRSDNSDNSDSEVPSAVRISRIVMWIQGLGMIVLAGLYVQSILSLRGLTGAELSKRFDGEITSQSEVSYSSLWLVAGTALVIGVTLAYCAWQLPTRARRIRQTALVAEGIFLALALVSGGDPISCV